MNSCLGIYIDKNFIKYAKLQKEENIIKISTFNIEFYENLNRSLIKIINKTNSSKIPININISDEIYNEFYIKSTFDKRDIVKSIDRNFKEICKNKKKDNNLLETRYILKKDYEDKFTVLHFATTKKDVKEKKQILKKYNIQSITPISTSIVNLLKLNKNENIVIINIEDKTKITTIIDGKIYSVDILKEGISEIIKDIDDFGNFEKKYRIYKNLTIDTSEDSDEENKKNIEKIIPILAGITEKAKKIIENLDINKIYITGAGASIDNIDLYFKENILNINCEILKPFFLETTSIKRTLREYIEVNSAVALALNGLGYINKNLNFEKKQNLNSQEIFKDKKIRIKKISPNEKLILRVCIVLVILIISFLGFSNKAYKSIEKSNIAITEVSNEVLKELSLMDDDLEKINTKTKEYTRMIENVKSLTQIEEASQTNRIITQNSIPNMLNKIMNLIPEQVKIISITNINNSKQILIEAESQKYEQLGYFSSILKTENVLKNIKSTSGSKDGAVVRITIEGELP